MAGKSQTLTPEDMKFCELFISTGQAIDSYIDAYNYQNKFPKEITEQSHRHKVSKRANQLLKTMRIARYIEEVQDRMKSGVLMTLENHLNNLMLIRNHALLKEDLKTALTAEMARGKCLGFYDGFGDNPYVKTDEKQNDEQNQLPTIISRRFVTKEEIEERNKKGEE